MSTLGRRRTWPRQLPPPPCSEVGLGFLRFLWPRRGGRRDRRRATPLCRRRVAPEKGGWAAGPSHASTCVGGSPAGRLVGDGTRGQQRWPDVTTQSQNRTRSLTAHQLQPATDTDVPGRYRPGRLPRPAAGVRAGTESCHCPPPTPARRGLLRFGKERGPEGRLRPSHLKGPGVYRRHIKL